MPDLTRLLLPRSVAVVGATDREGTYAHTTLLNLARAGFAGPVVGVHPTRRSAVGVPCVPTLTDVGQVDAVVIATPAPTVPAYVAEAAALGCGGAVVYAAGFAEAGRADLQAELRAAAAAMPVIGPNGNGLISVAGRAPLWGDAVTLPDTIGGVALVSDSGNIGVIGAAHRGGQGLHTIVSTGNAAVVGPPDVVEYLAGAEGVRAIALYVEGDGDGRRWCEALAACAERDVRVVVLKAGRSVRGAAAGTSHTAALVGDHAVFAAMVEEAGGVMVRQPAELWETARALAAGRRDARGVGILTCSGGDAAIAADLAEDFAVPLADLSAATREALRSRLPAAATVANPLDHTALVWADTEAIAALAETVGRDPAVGHLVYVQDEPPGLPEAPRREWRATRAGGVLGGERSGHATLVVATTPGQGGDDAIEGLDNALRAIAALRARPPDPVRLRDVAREAQRVVRPEDSRQGHAMSEPDAKVLLARYGIDIPRGAVVDSAEAAFAFIHEAGFPVALKAVVPGLEHKSDAGAVVLGVVSRQQIEVEVPRLLALAPGSQVLVEVMAEGGIEMLVSATIRGVIPTLTVGLGGVWAEALDDVAVIPLPADADRVRVALASLRGAAVLLGERGGPAYGLDGVSEVAATVGRILIQEGLTEIEVNPLLVRAGRAPLALDALMR